MNGTILSRNNSNNIKPQSHRNEMRNEKTNPYLLLRASKIARNNERLKSLGLSPPPPPPIDILPIPEKHRTSQNGTMETIVKSTGTREQRSSSSVTIPTRRSNRLRRKVINGKHDNSSSPLVHDDTSAQKEDTENKINGIEQIHARTSNHIDITSNEKKRKHNTFVDTRPPQQKSTTSSSSRSIEMNVKSIMDQYLGVELQSTGKSAVIDVSTNFDTNQSVSFNKYSGICEWKNHSLTLWVNIMDDTEQTYPNQFLEGGRKVNTKSSKKIAKLKFIKKLC